MVDHNQNIVKTGGNWEICDYIAGDLLKWVKGRGQAEG